MTPVEFKTKNKIFTAADKLFNQHGIKDTSIKAIIDEAKVARKSFYDHFDSKNALIVDYFKHRELFWRYLLESHVKKSKTSKSKILSIFDGLESWFKKKDFYGCPFIRGLTEFNDDKNSEIYELIDMHFKNTQQTISDILSDAGKDAAILADKISVLIIGTITVAQYSKDYRISRKSKSIAKLLLKDL